MKRTYGILWVMWMILLSVTVIPTSVSANEILISIDYPVVDGIDASFSFNMKYNPETVKILSGESINLNFAPEPKTVNVKINIKDILDANGISIPIEFSPYTQTLQNDITLPISRTPLGKETINSYVISITTGLAIVVDANIIGEIEATLLNDGGILSNNQLTWDNWGGKEVTLDTLNNQYLTVHTNYSYDVSLSFTLHFTVAGGSLYDYPIPKIRLGRVQFPQTVTMTIETINSYDEGFNDGYTTGYYEGNISGYENGTIDIYDLAYSDGYYVGYEDGANEIYDSAYSDGYSVGYDDGYDEAYQEIEPDQNGLPSIGVITIITTILVLAFITRRKWRREPEK